MSRKKYCHYWDRRKGSDKSGVLMKNLGNMVAIETEESVLISEVS